MSVENAKKMKNYAESLQVAYEGQLQGALDRMKKDDKQVFADSLLESTGVRLRSKFRQRRLTL